MATAASKKTKKTATKAPAKRQKSGKQAEPKYELGPVLEFLREVWALNHALERTSKHMEATLGVTAQQRMLIRIVSAYPGIAAGELAEVLHLDAGTISATVGRLEKRGLIKRRRDTEDRRRVTLEVTPKGRKLDAPAKETVEASIKRVLDATPAKEIARVRELLGKLAGSLAKNYEE